MRLSVPMKWVVCLAVLMGFMALADEPAPMAMANALARVSKKVNPEYPPAARQLNISGQQEVSIVVDAQGDVEEAKVVKGNAMFTQASLVAVKQWKFTPLVKDGQASRFTTVLVFNYQK